MKKVTAEAENLYAVNIGSIKIEKLLKDLTREDFSPLLRAEIMAEIKRRLREPRKNPRREVSRTRQHGIDVTVPKQFADPGAARIAALRKIVKEHQYAKIDGQMVDGYTASAIVQVYDAINETNKAKYRAMTVPKMAAVAWKLIKSNERTNPMARRKIRRNPSPRFDLAAALKAQKLHFLQSRPRRAKKSPFTGLPVRVQITRDGNTWATVAGFANTPQGVKRARKYANIVAKHEHAKQARVVKV